MQYNEKEAVVSGLSQSAAKNQRESMEDAAIAQHL